MSAESALNSSVCSEVSGRRKVRLNAVCEASATNSSTTMMSSTITPVRRRAPELLALCGVAATGSCSGGALLRLRIPERCRHYRRALACCTAPVAVSARAARRILRTRPLHLMLAKCANPACEARFRYFREGRLFQVDRKSDGAAHNGGKNGHNVEHFW